MAKKKTIELSTDRLLLIIALVGVIAISAVIGFIIGVVASPLDFDSNLPGNVEVMR